MASDMVSEKSAEELVEEQNDIAKSFYTKKRYDEALQEYNKLIELCPNETRFLGNRAACYMMLYKYADALKDAKKCIELDPKLFKAYARVIKCYLALGDANQAESMLAKLTELDPNNDAIPTEKNNLLYLQRHLREADAAYAIKDFRKVVYSMSRCCDVSTSCPRFKLMKAECLAFLGRYEEAADIANTILHIDKQNVDALYVRGLCLYFQNIDKAIAHFQQVLRLAPDHTKALELYKRAKRLKKKKEEGNEAYNKHNYLEALNLYTEALAIDPQNVMTNAKLHFNIATAAAKCGCYEIAIEECTEALKLDENYVKALARRASTYMQLKQYENAVRDYEKLYQISNNREHKRLLMEAKLELNRSKRKDYYKILGIDKNASTDDIKKAYRKRAMVHHPDRHASASDGEKKEQEKMFKEVGEAYGILSDPKKRSRYDGGQDISDLESGFDGFPDIFAFFG